MGRDQLCDEKGAAERAVGRDEERRSDRGRRALSAGWLACCTLILISLTTATLRADGGRTIPVPASSEEPRARWLPTRLIPAPEAVQAAAGDRDWLYAVSSTQIARHDRRSGERAAVSRGPAQHLNSAFLHDGRLYCAHSNYPRQPEHSDIRVLDLQTLELSVWHSFGESEGSLTWCVRHDGDWWCNFAFYGDEQRRSYLARFDADFRERERWSYPPEVLTRIGRHSLSGGLFLGDDLLATGHDDRLLFRLRPTPGAGVLSCLGIEPAPFSGQGIAVDPVTGGLIGIDRARRELVLAERETSSAPRLRVLTYNIHHGEGVDRRLDLERIARVIREVAPDVVALQEVDRGAARTGGVDQPQELARLTGMHVVMGENIPLQGGHYGNAVLSRAEILRSRNHLLPCLENGEQRGVLEVEFDWPEPGRTIRLLATHFDHRPDDRERQASAEAVNRLALTQPGQLAILAGDLNATPDSRTLEIVRTVWTPAQREPLPTIPVDAPARQIDYVLTSPRDAWRTIESRVLPEAVASDHRALLSVFELAEGDTN